MSIIHSRMVSARIVREIKRCGSKLMWKQRKYKIAQLTIAISLAFAIGWPSQTLAGSLTNAASPYLKSHANDPITWRPWHPKVFDTAKKTNKLVFLSIGYSSCHWCHRFARDTLSNNRVIKILNDQFVCVLVDREERPDLDNHYLKVMEVMTGASGWPANFVLAPDGTPLFAAGYLTPEPEFGQPGLLELLEPLASAWKDSRTVIQKDVDIIRSQVAAMSKPTKLGKASEVIDPRQRAIDTWSPLFDEDYGGFGRTSKFLLPNVLGLWLDEAVRSNDDGLLGDVLKTLDHMAAGGVRDQIGGAFHRYSVDRFWQVPHFEIMLSDNALMAQVYLRAYQATKNKVYADVAREILNDLLDRFRLPRGGFASALDSDSQQKEGYYYTWTTGEIKAALGDDASKPFIETYLDSKRGLIDGRSVLRLSKDATSHAQKRKEFAQSWLKLRAARADRSPLKRDDKLLVSWNALAVSAFAKAAQILGDERYREASATTIDRLLELAPDPKVLRHSYHDGNVSAVVFLDDYGFLIQALINSYELSFDIKYLERAKIFAQILIEDFSSSEDAPFQLRPHRSRMILPNQTILTEEGMPTGNAAALEALQRLSLFSANKNLETISNSILGNLGAFFETSAASAPALVSALDFRAHKAHEVVIVGERDDPATQRLLSEVYRSPLRGTVVALIAPDAPTENKDWPLLNARSLLDNKPAAYVCRKRLCDLPVNTPRELSLRLQKIVQAQR